MGFPVFILTTYCSEKKDVTYFSEALDAILNQTDPHFHLIIIDDCSPYPDFKEYLAIVSRKDKRIFYHVNLKNSGVSQSRNYGIKWAKSHRAPFVMFHDGDDISPLDRLEKTKKLFNHKEVDLVYSTFIPIDEFSNIRDFHEIAEDVRNTIHQLKKSAPEGMNAWLDLTLKFGYCNLTSATAVRTEIAIQTPFPLYRFSEDAHTWYRMMALAKNVVFDPSFPTYYRMPNNSTYGIASKDRLGKYFFLEKIKADLNGFLASLPLAEKTGKIPKGNREVLLFQFCQRLARDLGEFLPADLYHDLFQGEGIQACQKV